MAIYIVRLIHSRIWDCASKLLFVYLMICWRWLLYVFTHVDISWLLWKDSSDLNNMGRQQERPKGVRRGKEGETKSSEGHRQQFKILSKQMKVLQGARRERERERVGGTSCYYCVCVCLSVCVSVCCASLQRGQRQKHRRTAAKGKKWTKSTKRNTFGSSSLSLPACVCVGYVCVCCECVCDLRQVRQFKT